MEEIDAENLLADKGYDSVVMVDSVQHAIINPVILREKIVKSLPVTRNIFIGFNFLLKMPF